LHRREKIIGKMKIVSDGTPVGTYIYDENGNIMSNVFRVELDFEVDDIVVDAKLTVRDIELELNLDKENVTIEKEERK